MQRKVAKNNTKEVGIMSIGERITELRKEQNLSQGQLAGLLDVTRQAVSKWENDQSSPDTIKLIQLADVLDTDVEYLATGRRSYARRPPVVLQSTEVVEKPVVQIVEKIVETVVEKPVIQYVEKPVVEYVDKPVIKTVTRTKFLRNPLEFAAVGLAGMILGILLGWLI